MFYKTVIVTVLTILFTTITSIVTVHSANRPESQSPHSGSNGLIESVPIIRLGEPGRGNSVYYVSHSHPSALSQSNPVTTTATLTVPVDNGPTSLLPLDIAPMARINFEPQRLSLVEPISFASLTPRPRLTATALSPGANYPTPEPIQLRTQDTAELSMLGSTGLSERYASTQRVKPGQQVTTSSQHSLAVTCTVTTLANSGPGSLRQCLLNAGPGDTINFSSQVFPPIAPATIALSSPLPRVITDTLTIDGSNAGVILDGTDLITGAGLVIDGANGVKIRSLQILNFPWDGIALIYGATNTLLEGNLISGNEISGIVIQDAGTAGNRVIGNSIGVYPFLDILLPLPNTRGVLIRAAAQNNIIGGDIAGAGNFISSNSEVGILIQDPGTTGNQVQGNYIGTDDPLGLFPAPNYWGVVIWLGAHDNIIGGSTSGARNFISGNTKAGVQIQENGTDRNQVRGNYIGTDSLGTGRLGNGWGVGITSGASDNIIGGNTSGDRNIISGNNDSGIRIWGSGTISNQIKNNYIGIDVTGTAALSNPDGIFIGYGAKNNIIGGQTESARNVISGNADSGVLIQDSENDGTTGNQIMGNYIGTDFTGSKSVGNFWGIMIGYGAKDNIVWGGTVDAPNIISGNKYAGVQLEQIGTTGNRVMGNYIGTNVTGTTAVGNDVGVIIGFGAQSNIIGGETTSTRNLISGNRDAGVWIHDDEGKGTSSNQVKGNYIGTDITGTAPLGNDVGVVIEAGTKDNRIGGETEGARNIISGSAHAGILIQGNETMSNTVLGNYIGTDWQGKLRVDNFWGVGILLGAKQNLIGGNTPGARNLISGNTDTAIRIEGDETFTTMGNQVQGNRIGTDVTGTAPLSNTTGVAIMFGAKNNLIGGEAPGAGNLISGNARAGIQIQEIETTGNQVQGNYIGTNAEGTTPLDNDFGIVILRGARHNLIGGNTLRARNFISGNTRVGIQIEDSDTLSNTILGNYIGTNVTGTRPLGNYAGVVIWVGARNNVIGGQTTGAGNLISGNTDFGVVLEGGATNNRVQGNKIGTTANGMARLSNKWGILLTLEAKNNLIGGNTTSARNIISGNTKAGIQIQEEGTISNTIRGNYIGTNMMGTAPLSNMMGIVIGFGADRNIIGGTTPGARNIISGNAESGVNLQNSGTLGNVVLGNRIGTDVNGLVPLGNRWGVGIVEGAKSNIVGGNTPVARNLISGNTEAGVSIRAADGNRIQGNYIGSDVTGLAAVGNSGYGVYLSEAARSNTIGISNTIVYNGSAGVAISGENTLENTITRNIIHSNGGLPIDYLDRPEPISPIEIYHTAPPFVVSGTVCPNCVVEIFVNPSTTLAGTIYLGEAIAGGNGEFSLTWTNAPPLPYPALTVTDEKGTTSEFYSHIYRPPTIYLPMIVK